MPTTVVISANLQWVGAAKETTYGTASAAPTFWIPVDGSSVKYKPNVNVLTDQALRGFMGVDYQQVQGMRYDTLAYKTFLYLDSVYQHFLALFGKADTITGTADPFTHKTSLYNGSGADQAQPPSYTLFYFDGLKCWQIPGCIVSSVKLDVKVDELTSLDIQWSGMPATQIATPTNTPTTAKPWAAWNSTITLGGSALSVFSEVAIEYKRDVAQVNTINASQSPLEIFGGGVSVAGNLTAVYQGGATDVNMTDYLANTQPILVVKCAPIGDAVHFLQVTHSQVAYDNVDVSGSKWMEIAAQIKALSNATDALDTKLSPAQVQFLTTQSTAF